MRLIRDKAGRYKTANSMTLKEIAAAILIETPKAYKGVAITSPDETETFLSAYFKTCESEVFVAVCLNSSHEVLSVTPLFFGTIDGASVYPREVVKHGLANNAAAMIFAHNHPSGNSSPSNADISITKRLKDALELIDIRVLDHLIFGDKVTSLAALGVI